MPNENIEVEWIGTATKMTQVLDRLESKLDKQEKQLQKIGTTSKKSADMAAGSFNRLEAELNENERALKNIARGTAEFDRQRQKVDNLKSSLNQARGELTNLKAQDSPWPAVGKAMVTATGAATLLFGALMKVAQAQREIVSGGADLGVTVDTLARKFQVQTGLTDPEREEQTRKAIEISSEAGVKGEVGLTAATQLASSGFSDPVKGGSLKTVLGAAQASNFDGDIRELIKGLAQALQASGLEKTNANLEAIAVASQSLFKTTDFQMSELTDFAKQASVFSGANLNQGQALAGFTALREVLPAAESSRGLKNLIVNLQAGDSTKESANKLKGLGVKAGQVDFVGENLVDVLRTIKSSTDKMPEGERNAALIKAFGKENIASSKLLLQSTDRIVELEGMQKNKKQFRKDQLVAAGSMQADRNRRENDRLIDVLPNAEALHKQNEVLLRRENEDKAIAENFAVNAPAGAAAVVNTGLAANRTVDSIFGQGATDKGASAVAGNQKLLFDIFMIATEQVRATTETNELLRQQAKQPVNVKVPVRPQVAPLPAANVP